MMKSKIRYGSHSAHQLLVHFVFVTNNRFPMITKRREDRLKEIFAKVCRNFDAELIRFGADNEKNAARGRNGETRTPSEKRDPNHVHLLVRYPPRHSIATLAQHLKGESSYQINREEAEADRARDRATSSGATGDAPRRGAGERDAFRWSGTYFAKSVGAMDAATTNKYIANQGK